jgi:hypothetical protein
MIERICNTCHLPIKKTKNKVKTVCQGHVPSVAIEAIKNSVGDTK